jgi:DNA-binding transcriptional regulator YhcF (GntR family)
MSTIVTIDTSSDVPPYEQVRLQLARKINDGSLPVGTKLPTVRQLAGDLGLAVNTVARAYRELEGADLLETRGRAGTFVGSNGSNSRSRAAEAAARYVATTDGLGIARIDALAIVRASLDESERSPSQRPKE